jgi:sugar lactone lactonase YvrE
MLPLLAALSLVLVTPTAAAASTAWGHPGEPELLASGLDGGSGSTVGPDGALYVTEGVAGRLTRIDPKTGDTSVVADCLPPRVAPVGGAIDVAFLHGTAYVLVTLVSPEVGGSDVAGIYRIDGPHTCTVVADLGTWSLQHPPDTDFVVPVGLQFALAPYRGGFLVTDGHHNRVLFVTLDGSVHQVVQLPNVVPTGLDVRESKVWLAEAGPVPHRAKDGKVVTFSGTTSPELRTVASGAPLLVDVELGCGGRVFGLAQGEFPVGQPPATPAIEGTGQLRVADDGHFHLVVDDLDRPTSLEFSGDTAYVVTLGGDVWRIPDVCDD